MTKLLKQMWLLQKKFKEKLNTQIMLEYQMLECLSAVTVAVTHEKC